jgi:lipid-A-disaccharide synthase
MSLKVGLCATESSGDILGSDLIRNLKSKDPLIEFFGLGGSEMRKEGFNSFDSNEHFQVMGLIDPIFRINRILKKRNELIDHLIDKNIDIFIGIDSPSLNLGISRILKKKV